MRYFPNTKDRIDPNISWNDGPGFTLNDETTMNVERERYSEAMDSATHWVQRIEYAGSLNRLIETHTAIIRFAGLNGKIVNW